MKLTNVKAMVAKSLTVGLLAGAFALAAPAKASAQQFVLGVQFGSPIYDTYKGSYAREQYRRQQAYEAQQAYARQRAYDRYNDRYAYRNNDRRDHHDFDHDGGRGRR